MDTAAAVAVCMCVLVVGCMCGVLLCRMVPTATRKAQRAVPSKRILEMTSVESPPAPPNKSAAIAASRVGVARFGP